VAGPMIHPTLSTRRSSAKASAASGRGTTAHDDALPPRPGRRFSTAPPARVMATAHSSPMSQRWNALIGLQPNRREKVRVEGPISGVGREQKGPRRCRRRRADDKPTKRPVGQLGATPDKSPSGRSYGGSPRRCSSTMVEGCRRGPFLGPQARFGGALSANRLGGNGAD